jgi:DNA-binding SARP family transcriptional activator
MWLGMLGPLCVRSGDTAFPVRAGRQRSLLAALALHAGNMVSFDALAETVWNGSPPRSARATLRNYVKRLRQAAGADVGARIITRFPGYFLDASANEVDVLAFGKLCRSGGAAARAGNWQQASDALIAALGLWRGTPLADIPSEVLRDAHVPHLEQARLHALEMRIDADLHLGRADEVVGELQILIARNPLREHFHAQFMLALYQCGRQADALAAYRQARHVIVEELGGEPGPELQNLHQRVLSGDTSLLNRPASRESVALVPRPACTPRRRLPPRCAHARSRIARL